MAVSDSYTKERPNHWNYVPDASATPHTPFFVSTNNLEFVLLSEYRYLDSSSTVLFEPGGFWRVRQKISRVGDHQSFRRVRIKYVWKQPPKSIIEATCITMTIIEKSHVTPMKFNMAAENETFGKQDSFYHGTPYQLTLRVVLFCLLLSIFDPFGLLFTFIHAASPELGSGYSEPLVACTHATARMPGLW